MKQEISKTISDEDRRRIDEAIGKRRAEIAALDWDLLNDSVGVRQAEDALRKALDKVIERVEANDYYEVASLGYEDVSSGYVFLQRVMGGMQMNAPRKSELISGIAAEVGLSFEQVEPLAEAAFERARSEFGTGKPCHKSHVTADHLDELSTSPAVLQDNIGTSLALWMQRNNSGFC